MATPFLYIVGAKPNGPFKLGASTNINARLRSLQTGFHLTVSVIKKWRLPAAGLYRVELLSHKSLARYRLNGEWFSCTSDEMVEAVENVLKATKRGKDFSAYKRDKNAIKSLSAQKGGFTTAAKAKVRVDEGIKKIKDLWRLPSKQYSIKRLEEISGVARGSIVARLGNRVPAQIAYQAALKRKEKRDVRAN